MGDENYQSFHGFVMATTKNKLKARQVTTHTHHAVPVKSFNPFRKIGHWDFKNIKAGERWEFPIMKGPGCVVSIWMTVASRMVEVFVRRRVPAHRYLWINIYYDDEPLPAISCPMGHFFGNGTNRYVHFSSKFVGMTSGGYYSFLPMPFRKSCRVVMENRHRWRTIPLFYGAITYLEMEDLPSNLGYLGAQFKRSVFKNSPDIEGSIIPNNPHIVLDESGFSGHYVGMNLTIYPTSLKSRFKFPYFLFPYLEGNLKVYVDNEVHTEMPLRIDKPVGAPHGKQSIEFTGVEDYFLSGWYYNKGAFYSLYHGCPVKSVLTGAVSQYRFHEFDPYPWKKRILITLTHGEFDNVDCIMESLAFYYKFLDKTS